MDPNTKWWSPQDVAVVTGANKGIGFEVARLLAEAGMHVILAARNPELGTAALSKLKSLPSVANPSLIEFERLDIAGKASVEAFASAVKQRYPQGLTALINNAGFAYKGSVFGPDEAEVTLNTNFRGTADVCEALAPLLIPNRGRVINVSSGSGALSNIPGAGIRSQLGDPSDRAQFEGLAAKFVSDIRAGRHREQGWSSSMYGISKALETAYTRVLARQLADKGIMVNAVCPGWCATDMSSWGGPRSAAQGADTPVWLATLPPPGVAGGELVTGGFWRDRERQPF